MQPDVAGGETTSFPSTTSARIEDAPQVQSFSLRFAPVACAELSVRTVTSAKRRHALTRSRWPQNRTGQGWQEVSRVAWAARLILESSKSYFPASALNAQIGSRTAVRCGAAAAAHVKVPKPSLGSRAFQWDTRRE